MESTLFVVEVPDFSPAVAATFAHLNRIVSVIREPTAGTWIFPNRFVEGEGGVTIDETKVSGKNEQQKN